MNNDKITYEEFVIMLKASPKMCYTLYDKAENEIERLNNIIEKTREYINDRFHYDKETGAYHLTHTFDSSNVFDLFNILKGEDKE